MLIRKTSHYVTCSIRLLCNRKNKVRGKLVHILQGTVSTPAWDSEWSLAHPSILKHELFSVSPPEANDCRAIFKLNLVWRQVHPECTLLIWSDQTLFNLIHSGTLRPSHKLLPHPYCNDSPKLFLAYRSRFSSTPEEPHFLMVDWGVSARNHWPYK